MKHFAEVVFLRHWARFSLFFAPFLLNAQDIPVGTWRTHFSYMNARNLEVTSDKVFCAAENGLFSVTISDKSTRKLSKIDGLSDVGVSSMAYHAGQNLLVLGYRSGYVDFVFENEIISVSEIADSDLEGSKQINDIAFDNPLTFLATDLGIIAVTTSETEIRENFVQIGSGGSEVAVSEIRVLGSLLFAQTNEGIQSGDLAGNLLDFNNWVHYPSTGNLENLTVVGTELFARDNLDLYQLSGNTWIDTGSDLPAGSSGLFSDQGELLTVANQAVFRFTGTLFESIRQVSATRVNDLVSIAGEYWIADGLSGLVTQDGEVLSPAGPRSDQYSGLRILNGETFGFHSPDPALYDGSIQVSGYSLFSEGSWSVEEIADFRNISDVTSFEGTRFFSSIGDGLFNESANEITTDIPGSNADPDTIISTLTTGDHLWISSWSGQEPVHRWNGEGWSSFSSALFSGNEIYELVASEREIIWVRKSDGSVSVFEPEDMSSAILTGLPGAVLDVEASIEDDAWVATPNGPAGFADASFIFQSSQVILPTFESRILFENEQVSAIKTDGGNRVWFATDRGLWIFDAGISEQAALFNFENSPIPSDKVLDLAYNGENGEMFVLTDKGLVSYRSASSIGSNAHRNVNVFPNPVNPGYTGLVGIEGLARNVSVKITDIRGNLVKEINASGGSASWDLRNVRNTEVVTGIYLMFSSSADGTETFIGKIAVVR